MNAGSRMSIGGDVPNTRRVTDEATGRSASGAKRRAVYSLPPPSPLPHALTEHGAIMLASLLNTRITVQASVQVVRALIRLRDIPATHTDLARKLEDLE